MAHGFDALTWSEQLGTYSVHCPGASLVATQAKGCLTPHHLVALSSGSRPLPRLFVVACGCEVKAPKSSQAHLSWTNHLDTWIKVSQRPSFPREFPGNWSLRRSLSTPERPSWPCCLGPAYPLIRASASEERPLRHHRGLSWTLGKTLGKTLGGDLAAGV